MYSRGPSSVLSLWSVPVPRIIYLCGGGEESYSACIHHNSIVNMTWPALAVILYSVQYWVKTFNCSAFYCTYIQKSLIPAVSIPPPFVRTVFRIGKNYFCFKLNHADIRYILPNKVFCQFSAYPTMQKCPGKRPQIHIVRIYKLIVSNVLSRSSQSPLFLGSYESMHVYEKKITDSEEFNQNMCRWFLKDFKK